MKPERWRQIEETYLAALDLDESERSAFLDRVCENDSDLRREIESLLANETQSIHFIDSPAMEVAAEMLSEGQSLSLIGQQISRYRVVSRIGAGGMGEVYLAEDTALGRKVALKLLPAEFTDDRARVSRFKQEARAASALNHPNIITIHEIGQEGETHFIATEFIEGLTLRDRIRQGPIPINDAIETAIQVASALAAAHAAGIAHRDIKPENIMLRPDSYVKVLDFGLAKLAESNPPEVSTASDVQTAPGTVMGTVRYMSPEQMRGQQIDARTDIFSLGIVLYEMLSGKPPFSASTMADLMAAILNTEPLPLRQHLPEIPEKLNSIVARTLRKNREDRYQTSMELLSELKSLQEELEFESKLRSSGANLVSNQTSSKKWLLPVAVITIIALVAGGIFYWRRANLTWARAQIPLIESLSKEQKYFEAYELAVSAKKYLPDNPVLERLMPIISDTVSVTSTPSGANVYIKRFSSDESRQSETRQLIGVTPINNFNVARGQYILYVDKEGYAIAERTISSILTPVGEAMLPPDEPTNINLNLIEAGKIPEGMVMIPGSKYTMVSWGKPTTASVQLDDFFIDKYEVTNRQYKEFINAGGYVRKEFWKYPFIKDGRAMNWGEATKEFRDRTGLAGPRNWAGQNFPADKAEHPVTDITWHEAAAYAAFRGKQLPTIFQWEKAARNGLFTHYSAAIMPWGPVDVGGSVERHANFRSGGTVTVNSFEFGMSPFGCYQMAGNVSEWCLNETADGFVTAGGSWDDLSYLFGHVGVFPSFYSSNKLGFRCALNLPDSKSDPGAARIDTSKQVPIYTATDEAVFKSMLSHYRYDQTPLGAEIIEVKDTDEWRREKITYIGANEERAIAYLYLPKNFSGPFQVIHFVPAGDVYGGYVTMAESVEMVLASHIRSGRAVFAVVFKGFKERENPSNYMAPSYRSVKRREDVVRNAIDLGRGLDYLASRSEIDTSRVAYYGYSQGAEEGLIYSAVNSRYKTVVLTACGLRFGSDNIIPEARPANFASHIRVPVLMLSGRYDEAYNLRTETEPLYKLLRHPKRLLVYDGGHTPPIEIEVPAVNAWLDEMIGPVTR
jgi:serine/threonine protein kinase/formylglycine-generating enzyme required for sulfatase activity/dienelactone hydrolase